MNEINDRREAFRRVFETPEVAIIYSYQKVNNLPHFVSLHNISKNGAFIKSSLRIDPSSRFKLVARNVDNQWDTFNCSIAWEETIQRSGNYSMGLEFSPTDNKPLQPVQAEEDIQIDTMDLEFLLNNRLLKVLPSKGICPFLNSLIPRNLSPGVQFITQDEEGESLFIIQKGLCTIKIEKDGEMVPVAQRREGSVVGEMALLTKEPRTANVISESNMKLWELNRSDFDRLVDEYPDLMEFLTELLTNRLENSTIIAVRNVGRYLITHQLGQGGWSIVYKGKHKALNMPVAIKMLKHNIAINEEFLDRFRQEGRTIAQMNHKNIVRIYDIEEIYRTIFIVMECLEGETLEALLKRKGALPFDRALSFLIQICSGLAYAHNKGIVHRDIKPGNIFIMPDDHIKILDFGLACTHGKEDFSMPGTVHYMAPEQIHGHSVDGRTDIYSLGILAYEMFTGENPYANTDVKTLLDMHFNHDIPDPSLLIPDLPEPVRAFILKACRKSLDDRYNSMQAVIKELLPVIQPLDSNNEKPVERNKQITVLLISHFEDQELALKQLLDEFGSRASELGLDLNITGKSDI